MALTKNEYLKEVIQQEELLYITNLINKKERIKKYEYDFKGFLEYYLSHYFTLPFCELHENIIEICENLILGNKHLQIAPRGYAKSTFWVIGFTLWCLCYEKHYFLVLISSTTRNMQRQLQDIVREIETNERIIEDFDLKPAYDKHKKFIKWTDSEIVLSNQCCVVAKGSNEAIRGLRFGNLRPQVVILDDVENQEKVKSDIYREDLKKWFAGTIRYLGDVDTIYIIVGTVLHWDSLIYEFYKRKDKRFIIHYYQAIKKDGTPLWKEKHTLEQLEQIKSEDEKAFQTEYMNVPVSEEERVFDSNRFKTFHFDLENNQIITQDKTISIKNLYIWSYVDPALEEKKTSDYSCLITLGQDNQNIYVLECTLVKYSPDKLTDLIVLKRKEGFAWHELGVESNGFQVMLINELERKFKLAGMHVPLRKIVNTTNKIARIKTLNPFIERGVIQFRNDMKTCYPKLIDQMNYFPQSKLDGCDALHGCYYMQQTRGMQIIE